MRISDWSSDVCSSDLAHGTGMRAPSSHRTQEQAGLAVRNPVDRADLAQDAVEIGQAGGVDVRDQVPIAVRRVERADFRDSAQSAGNLRGGFLDRKRVV